MDINDIKIGDIYMVDFTNDKDRFTGIRPCLILEVKDNEYTIVKLNTHRDNMKGITIKKEHNAGLEQDAALVKYINTITSESIMYKVGSFDLDSYIGKSIKYSDKLENTYCGTILKVIPYILIFVVSFELNGLRGQIFVPIHAITEVIDTLNINH